MEIKTAKYVKSSINIGSCPTSEIPEFAFIGRSNVGKSSLINMLTGISRLAKISETPGKTRLINHFLINESWFLVDLPGYGYARSSKKERTGYERLIKDYIIKRENLVCLFVLIDCRLEPQKNDLEFVNWLGRESVPFILLFTKTDKLTQAITDRNIANYKNELLKTWEELPELIITSAKDRRGKEEILNFIERNL